jgi:hypothetical protein
MYRYRTTFWCNLFLFSDAQTDKIGNPKRCLELDCEEPEQPSKKKKKKKVE